MKSYLTPLLFTVASLVAISANAGAPSYFIPTEPTVTAPADLEGSVETTPTLTSSNFLFTEYQGSGNEPTLSTSNWVISKKSDNITILGSESASREENGRVRSLSEFSFEYEIPFAITISGQTATKLQVATEDGYHGVGLLSSDGNIIAYTDIEFGGFGFQSERNFIISKTSSNSLLLQWHMINAESTEAILEFILVDGGLNVDETTKDDVFGWRTTPNEYTNDLFSSISGGAGCIVALNNSASITPRTGEQEEGTYIGDSLSRWKAALSSNYNEFFLACTSKPGVNAGEYAYQLKELTSVDVISFQPEINVFSSPTENYTLTDGEALSLSTEYIVQVQHIGVYGELTGGSNWSTPASFTTRAADTNYQVTAPTDLTFTAGQAKDLAFNISNTGSEAGSPQVTIRLPFEAFNVVDGTLKDFFSASIGGQDCEMTQSGGKTDFICQLDSLTAAAEIQLAAKITVEDDTVKSIEYQVCDLDKCDDTAFTAVNISVTEPESAAPSPAASSSSSSGGSMFWLFLMAPLLLIRRK